jgi:hypothetical protein
MSHLMDNRTTMKATALAALILIMVAACTSPRARLPVQHYVPATTALVPLGALHLSNTQLRFEALEGHMNLEYVGIMPESAGPDIAGSSIYRVKNAQAFFKKNSGKAAFCSEQPLWVAVSSENGAPAWSTEIWVGLLTLKDWQQFDHGTDRVCLGGDFHKTAG